MHKRGRWTGMWTIVRFNWPFYVIALAVLIVGIITCWWLPWVAAAVIAGCLWFLLGSLGVSHWVYDRSDLYRWKWLENLPKQPEAATFCHSGFDETSGALIGKYPAAEWRLLDHYDGKTMTEASIRRARAAFPPTPGTVACSHAAWEHPSGVADLVFGILAIHELRSEEERAAWFAEARRCLSAQGRVVIVEHVRDLANFMAFGPGFLHFHSVASWQRSWSAGGMTMEREFRVTPFVRIFVLKHA